MSLSEPASLAFDDVVIDFAGRRLLRGGAEQPLEPKAFAVLSLLSLLSRAPGQVFARDEILDAVWGHRHITPGVLNRVVTLLRHALGEDAQHPRLLHTLHGTGYRFDLPAQEVAAPTVPPSEERRASPDRRAQEEVPGAIPFEKNKRGTWPTVLVALLVLAMAVLGWREYRSSSKLAPVLPAPIVGPTSMPTLVVMPLKAIGHDEAGHQLADGLGEEIIGTLAQIDGLRVIARESAAIAASDWRTNSASTP